MEVVVEVHLVDAGVLQGRRATGPATASEKNGSENRPDRPTAVGPVFAPATRGGPAEGTDNIRAEIHSKGSAQAPGWLPSRPPGAEDRRRRGNRHGSVRKKRAF